MFVPEGPGWHDEVIEHKCNHKDDNNNFLWVNSGFGHIIQISCKRCGELKTDYYKNIGLGHLLKEDGTKKEDYYDFGQCD